MSKKTQEEFDLKPSDIPPQMRPDIDDYTNHVDQNKRVVKNLNEISKVVYLSKIKFNIQNKLNREERFNMQKQ